MIKQLLKDKKITAEQYRHYLLFTDVELAGKWLRDMEKECLMAKCDPNSHGGLAYIAGRRSVIQEILFDIDFVQQQLEVANAG